MHNIFWALIILFAVAAFLRMDWVYYLVYVVGGIWVFSHIWMRRSLGRMQMMREIPARAFAGETIDARLFGGVGRDERTAQAIEKGVQDGGERAAHGLEHVDDALTDVEQGGVHGESSCFKKRARCGRQTVPA